MTRSELYEEYRKSRSEIRRWMVATVLVFVIVSCIVAVGFYTEMRGLQNVETTHLK